MPKLSENAISFFGAGGHKHDGVSSTLISTATYSLFDFNPGYIGSQSRISIQQTNQTALEEWVMNIVNTKVLAPAGLDLAPGLLSGKSIRANTITAVELQANTITADEIAANAVTANELAANLVLVNNVIRSNSYDGTIAANNVITSSGTTGWAITSAGQAVFTDAVIRGNVTANAGTIGGWNVDSDSLYSGTKSSNGNYATSGITIGSSGFISAKEFRLDADGNAHFKGDLNGASIVGVTGRFTGSVTVDGDLTAGNTTIYANGQITNGGYTLSATGALTATSGSIGGSVTIGGTAASTVVNSAANAITSSQVQNNLGGAGITTITGGKISTGIISSVGGTRTINLDTGAISFGNFTVSAAGAAVFAGSVTGSTISGSTVTTGTWSAAGSTGLKLDSDGYITGSGGGVKIRNFGTNGTDGATGTLLFGDQITVPNLYPNYIQLNVNNTWNQNGEAYIGGGSIRPLSLDRIYGEGGAFVRFYNTSGGSNAGVAGSIVYGTANTGRTILINYTSDARLKENIENIENATAVIKNMLPRSFNFTGSSVQINGFIAQELYEVYPTSVTVGGEDPNEDPWGIDYGTLTPILTAALKESIAKIEELEARIQTLEGV